MNFLHFKDSISQQWPLGFYHFSRWYVIRTSSNEVLLKKVIHQDFHRVISKICKIIIFSGLTIWNASYHIRKFISQLNSLFE